MAVLECGFWVGLILATAASRRRGPGGTRRYGCVTTSRM
jgi:hypothetical protein